MTDRTALGDSESGSGSRRRPLELVRALPRVLPGTAPSAPKRNVLVVLGYLFVCMLAIGFLWPVL